MDTKYFNTQMASTIAIINKWFIEPIKKTAKSVMGTASLFLGWYLFGRNNCFFSPNTIVLLAIWSILILMHLFYRPMF